MDKKGKHVQLLCWELFWSQETQLIDLVGFTQMCRHNLISFLDPTSKHSDVGHHASVVVKIRVKHQGLERVIDVCIGPTDIEKKQEKKPSEFLPKIKHISVYMLQTKHLRWNPVHNCLQNRFNICSMFG